jgi:hypothetical protein
MSHTIAYYMRDCSETYPVALGGYIGRRNMSPSKDWQALALVRLNNFGYVIERIPFEQWDAWLATNPAFTYKNGKPRFHLVDLDHGTRRLWGCGLYSVYKA